MKKPSGAFIFWIMLALGGIAVTVCYVMLQNPGAIPVSSNLGNISEIDKLYIEQMMDQTKWLESIAYATLVGMIVLKLKNPGMMESWSYAASASLLIISIYGGFLGHDVILISLTKGLPLMYTALGTLPYVTQFWSLLIALALLAKKILIPKIKAAHLLIVALFLGRIAVMGPARADAQTGPAVPADPVNSCTVSWAQSRFSSTPSANDQTTISTFVSLLATRSQVSAATAQSCGFVDSTLDNVRYASSVISGEDKYPDTIALVQLLGSQLNANAAAPGVLLGTLLQDLQVWRLSTGSVLIQTSHPGVTISLGPKVIGLTPFLYIATPGSYTMSADLGGAQPILKTITVIANVKAIQVIP
jgi:hypothetical protein